MKVYLSSEELTQFINSIESNHIGHSYEWEGEDVVHLRLKPLTHSFGLHGEVEFVKEDATSQYPKPWRVFISESGQLTVSKLENDEYVPVEYEFIPAKEDMYSRSKGILEVNALSVKKVVIIGLGSFGSQIAIELAKAGVEHFSLFDFDRVELHNLARHTCVINDLGRLKTDAIYDAILGKNPYCEVLKFPININKEKKVLEQQIQDSDLVICATDNNSSRFNISELLVKYSKPGIFGRAVTRAEGGDVFRYTPGGPCYCCLIGTGFVNQADEEITDENSSRQNGVIPAYMSAEDADALVQVGLSSDIEPICNLMVKLALVQLSRGVDTGIRCLEAELVYDYYMWANRRERRHKNWFPMPGAGAKPTILRWYGSRIPKEENCPCCSAQLQFNEASGSYLSNLDDVKITE